MKQERRAFVGKVSVCVRVCVRARNCVTASVWDVIMRVYVCVIVMTVKAEGPQVVTAGPAPPAGSLYAVSRPWPHAAGGGGAGQRSPWHRMEGWTPDCWPLLPGGEGLPPSSSQKAPGSSIGPRRACCP